IDLKTGTGQRPVSGSMPPGEHPVGEVEQFLTDGRPVVLPVNHRLKIWWCPTNVARPEFAQKSLGHLSTEACISRAKQRRATFVGPHRKSRRRCDQHSWRRRN